MILSHQSWHKDLKSKDGSIFSGSLASSVFDPMQALVGASGGVYALIGGYFMNILVVRTWLIMHKKYPYFLVLKLFCLKSSNVAPQRGIIEGEPLQRYSLIWMCWSGCDLAGSKLYRYFPLSAKKTRARDRLNIRSVSEMVSCQTDIQHSAKRIFLVTLHWFIWKDTAAFALKKCERREQPQPIGLCSKFVWARA